MEFDSGEISFLLKMTTVSLICWFILFLAAGLLLGVDILVPFLIFAVFSYVAIGSFIVLSDPRNSGVPETVISAVNIVAGITTFGFPILALILLVTFGLQDLE